MPVWLVYVLYISRGKTDLYTNENLIILSKNPVLTSRLMININDAGKVILSSL